MMPLYVAVLIVCSILGMTPVALAIRFRRYCKTYDSNPPFHRSSESFEPKVTVLLPCKGVDPGFKENLQTIFQQDLPEIQLVFATATDDDPACTVIQEAMSTHPNVNAKLVHAGIPDSCSQQNNNQLAAAAAARQETEIFVVMDSDIRVPSNYVTKLIEPLQDPKISAATGYRWYSPVKGGFGSWLRSTWNAGGYFGMPDPKRNFAWGGSMTFRKADFPLQKLRSLWGRTLSDDHPLTGDIQKRGGTIVFTPHCVAVSHEDSTLGSTLEWTNRQTLVTRVYNKPFWASIFILHGCQVACTLTALVLLILASIYNFDGASALLVGPLILPFVGISLSAFVLLPTISRLLPVTSALQIRRHALRYVILAGPASLLSFINSFASIITSKMTWRGVTYHLVGPDDTNILSIR